jgi:hypothetical protein
MESQTGMPDLTQLSKKIFLNTNDNRFMITDCKKTPLLAVSLSEIDKKIKYWYYYRLRRAYKQ